jgi:hypothetical protein
MSTPREQTGSQPTEEELRAAYEAEIKKIRVEHVLLEHVVTLVNLGMRRTGLAPGTESERDPGQVRVAIEAIRAVLPLVERTAPQQIAPIKEALSQLQLAYVRIGGAAPAGTQATPEAAGAGAAPGGAQGDAGAAPGGAGAAPGGAGAATADASSRAGSGQTAEQEPPPKPGEPGPAQRSGRLWVPGQ